MGLLLERDDCFQPSGWPGLARKGFSGRACQPAQTGKWRAPESADLSGLRGRGAEGAAEKLEVDSAYSVHVPAIPRFNVHNGRGSV